MDGVRDLRDDQGLLAYAVWGEGPALVFMQDLFRPLDSLDDDPRFARLLEDLGSFASLVVFDRSGIGFSDPITDWDRPLVDTWAQDLARIIEGVVGEPAAVFGTGSMSGRTVLRAAQLRPQLVKQLVVMNVLTGYHGWEGNAQREVVANVDGQSDLDFLSLVAPSRADDPEARRERERAGRRGVSAADARRIWEKYYRDPRPEGLSEITVPTTVLLRPDVAFEPAAASTREVADQIPGARLVELSGADLYPSDGDLDEVVGAMADALEVSFGGSRASELVTMLFSDIVDSTNRARQVGDVEWRALLERHDDATARIVKRHGGTVVKQTGDGVLATFAMPTRALRAAAALSDELSRVGLPVRIGVHTAEVERRGEDVNGTGVNLAARIMGQAAADEVLVSAAIPLLVTGSDHEFTSRGQFALKGFPGHHELYSLATPASRRT